MARLGSGPLAGLGSTRTFIRLINGHLAHLKHDLDSTELVEPAASGGALALDLNTSEVEVLQRQEIPQDTILTITAVNGSGLIRAM